MVQARQKTLDFTPHRNKPSIVTTWSTLFILLAFSTTLKVVISVGKNEDAVLIPLYLPMKA
jgi:hypothetical protein